ncbi:hypothetical protein HDU93_005311, partial [Gonapodya sp. JEL0774]
MFLAAQTRGLFGFVFNDFGPSFLVTDQTGEEPVWGLISDINDEGVVSTPDQLPHGLVTGDVVVFDGVTGIEELNNGQGRTVKVLNFTAIGLYGGGGMFTQVKQSQTWAFKPLRQAALDPTSNILDFTELDKYLSEHVGLQSLDQFLSTRGRLPEPMSESDAAAIRSIAQVINRSLAKPISLCDKIISELSYQSRGDLSPMASVLGGVVAHEVLKACSGKSTPIHQFFYFDSLKSLPTAGRTVSSCAPRGSRYDGQIAVFGAEFQEKLARVKEFL